MIALIALLAAQAATLPPVTEKEVVERSIVCIALAEGKADENKVIEYFKLDTPQKQRDFVIGCGQFIYGAAVGMKASMDSIQTTDSKTDI